MGTLMIEIALLRKTLNLSMRKFGDRIGVTASSVNKLEKGELTIHQNQMI